MSHHIAERHRSDPVLAALRALRTRFGHFPLVAGSWAYLARKVLTIRNSKELPMHSPCKIILALAAICASSLIPASSLAAASADDQEVAESMATIDQPSETAMEDADHVDHQGQTGEDANRQEDGEHDSGMGQEDEHQDGDHEDEQEGQHGEDHEDMSDDQDSAEEGQTGEHEDQGDQGDQ